ncbi:MAG: hypothetical protein ACRD1V_02910 [Vicinamibacterales bacterium]
MKWIHKFGRPGQPWMVGLDALGYGILGLVILIAYIFSRLH